MNVTMSDNYYSYDKSLDDLYHNFEYHNASEYMYPTVRMIIKNFLPSFDYYPYWKNSKMAIIDKFRFIDVLYQHHFELAKHVNQVDLTILTILYDMPLVVNPLKPKFNVYSRGHKAFKLAKKKYEDLIIPYTHHNKYNEYSIIKSLDYVGIKPLIHTDYEIIELANYIEDINRLYFIYLYPIKYILNNMELDYKLLDTVADNKIIKHRVYHNINTIYGNNGIYKIKSNLIASDDDIRIRYQQFKNNFDYTVETSTNK